MLPWRKVALATAAGIALVAVMLFVRTGDPMLLVFGLVVAGMAAAFFGLAWLLLVGLRRTAP
jgi:hypothetical protein